MLDFLEVERIAGSASTPIPPGYANPHNSFYGNEQALKRYCAMVQLPPLKANIGHGPDTWRSVWACDAHTPLPAVISCGGEKYGQLADETGRMHFSVGPYILYSLPSATPDEFLRLKSEFGKTLTFFLFTARTISGIAAIQAQTCLRYASMFYASASRYTNINI